MTKLFIHLGLALAIGFLIGIERGWQERAASEGTRIAGIRTFGLIGLLGGLWSLLAESAGILLLGLAFLAFSALIITAHILDTRDDRDVGITTAVAALTTFALGALCVAGYPAIAAASAVVTASLLSLKPLLHRWLKKIEPAEWYATLKLLLISVVLLPVLPNKGYGPWQVLNPYELWWLVVLIASISYVGYVAMKLIGTRSGLLLTGLLGGIVSSTAVTVNFAGLSGKSVDSRLLATGVLVASATMFPRLLIVISIINYHLLAPLLLPMAIMALFLLVSAAWLWRMHEPGYAEGAVHLDNPFQIKTALQFGLLLAGIMLLSVGFRHWLGDTGIYLASALSGLADVDAISISIARMARGTLAGPTAVSAIVIAAAVNTVVKGGLFWFIARGSTGRKLTVAMSVSALCGMASLWFL